MAASEVFRPSNGELLVRDSVTSHGPAVATDVFRKEGSRPATQGGYRFGQLSHNSFFTRHNPHPGRVRHLKGLLDVPICSVNDDGYFANPRYSLSFPPNQHNSKRLANWKGRIPVNAINVNSQLHPINTVTGLQYFMGLESYPWREKAIPRVGLVPVTESWRDELQNFTKALGLDELTPAAKIEDDARPRTTQYSAETGRIIPPPSRMQSRGGSRKGRNVPAGFVGGSLQHISADPDLENMVLVMLCQILQTEDINAVQAWLCSSGQREKEHVMGLVKSAMAGREEYYKQYPAEFVPDIAGKSKLPPINKPSSSSGETNRLVLDDSVPEWQKVVLPPTDAPPAATEDAGKPVIDDDCDGLMFVPEMNQAVFKPLPSPLKKPLTPAPLPPAPPRTAKAECPPTPGETTRLKYTKSPANTANMGNMWSQNHSLNTF